MSFVQYQAHGGDGCAAGRSRLAALAGAAVACREAESQARKAVVLAVPKRLRYFLQRDAAVQGAVLRIFLRAVEHCLREHSPGCSAAARLGAVAFIHRFGSALNEHLHFHSTT
jgi:Putative transposase